MRNIQLGKGFEDIMNERIADATESTGDNCILTHLLISWIAFGTEQQLERVQSEMKRQGTQLQEANLQLDRAKQALQESTQSLKASQKAAEYVASSRISLQHVPKQPCTVSLHKTASISAQPTLMAQSCSIVYWNLYFISMSVSNALYTIHAHVLTSQGMHTALVKHLHED